jgi:selenocysteine-specific elongation factor
MRRFAQSPFSPPSIKECQVEVGEEIVNALIDLGELTAVSPEVVFRKQDLDQMMGKVRGYITERGQISVADARDLFDSSRKYMLALLEYLDTIGITVRDGDYRKLRR